MHILNISATTVQSFRLFAQNLWKELMIQSYHPVLAITQKFSKFEKAVILSKMIFFPFQRQVGAHIQYVCNNCAKNQIAKKLVEGVDYTNLLYCISHNLTIFKVSKGCHFVKNVFSFQKKQLHIFNMAAIIVQSFRLIA